MEKIITFTFQDKSYQAVIHKKSKRIRRINFRYRDGIFYVSSPYMVREKYIVDLLQNKYAEYFLSREKPSPITDTYIYIYGEKYVNSFPNELKFSDGSKIKYKDKDDFYKKAKKIFKPFIEKRISFYESQMGLEKHNVRVQHMKSRYGSFSKKTNTININTSLLHYSLDVIDAVIVHELAHHLELNHSKNFYNIVLKYYPNYKQAYVKLKKGQYK